MEITGKTAMLAKAGEPRSDWVLEPKYDGHRLLAQVEDGRVRMFARSGVDKSGKVPAVESALAELPSGTVLDGEIVSLSREGGEWAEVQRIMGADNRASTSLTYVCFDILELDGHDVRGLPQTQRRELLEKVFETFDLTDESAVAISPQTPYSQEAVDALIAAGWEGAIVKSPTGRYTAGRNSTTWFKVKAMDTVDVVVTGATAGKGKFEGMIGALTFGQFDDEGNMVERGRCSGMNDAMRLEFTKMLDECTLAGTVIEIRHFGIHPTDGMKSPQFKRLRTDKDFRTVHLHDR